MSFSNICLFFLGEGDVGLCISKKFYHRQKGATMVEYAFMVALIAIVGFIAVTNIGQEVKKPFNGVNSTLTSVHSG